MNATKQSYTYLTLLSQVLLPNAGASMDLSLSVRLADRDELWKLAISNHVIARAFPVLRQALGDLESDKQAWFDEAVANEHARIQHALSFLAPICEALEEAGDVVVIKSLDHWPDLGSDLDLYTNGDPERVVAIMCEHFKAELAERSWGDRLANKWNFVVPGLPELVEIHVARLGQTGEQIAITQSLIARSRHNNKELKSRVLSRIKN